MRLNRTRVFQLTMLAFLSTARLAWADDGIAKAYTAILQGDYETGKTAVASLLQTENANTQAQKLATWLDSFSKVIASREELRSKTYNWCVENARKALADGKVYLALSFAAKAQTYAADAQKYSGEPWLQELTTKALAEAAQTEKDLKWRRANAYYLLLETIHSDNEEIKHLREHAGQHARLEYIYSDAKAVERRTKDISRNLVEGALDLVDRHYYQKPDYKRMAEGALQNLDTLCEAAKLYGVFDGLANPDLRNVFIKKLSQEKQDIARKTDFNGRDLQRLLTRIINTNKESVELPESLLTIEFVEGAFQKLDEFTSVVWPAEVTEFDKQMMGEFQGVGIQLGIDEATSRLKVVTPLEDSPALKAGIQPGDLIVEVDGKTTKGWSTDDAVREITGPAGTKVKLSLFRPSSGDPIDFILNRQKIQLKSVRGVNRLSAEDGGGWNYLLDPDLGVAYVRLSGFTGDSARELAQALENAKSHGMKGLILDVRRNPGGLLEVAINIVSLFLHDGEVVSTKGRKEPKAELEVDGKAKYADLPLIVLVDDSSASASEILSGALQDHNRAIVLGERTYGKGSVQRVLPLGQLARLKLTTALYYLPNGRSPHKMPGTKLWGVDPGWAIKLTPKEKIKAYERENSTNVIHNEKPATPGLNEEGRKKRLEELKAAEAAQDKDDDTPLLSKEEIVLLGSDPFQAPDNDPQLETALLHMRAKLAGGLPWPKQLVAHTPNETATTQTP